MKHVHDCMSVPYVRDMGLKFGLIVLQPTQQLNASLQSLFHKHWVFTMSVGAANKGIGTVTKYPIDIRLSLFDTWRGAPHILIPFDVFSIDNTDERSQWQQWRWDFDDGMTWWIPKTLTNNIQPRERCEPIFKKSVSTSIDNNTQCNKKSNPLIQTSTSFLFFVIAATVMDHLNAVAAMAKKRTMVAVVWMDLNYLLHCVLSLTVTEEVPTDFQEIGSHP